ncbi:MAG: HEPN domain-containing protein [Deltaproteobacteria bacterium]|nr:HEPN domain-containing protein [Deltaproteobacteria bacterium]
MSTEKNRAEAYRWFRTAEDDLDTAEILATNGKYAHSCFHAQQAAEKAVKALFYFEGDDPWGHSVKKLIHDLEGVNLASHESLKAFSRSATVLDRFYIPTRYPNGLPDITPDEAFNEEDSAACFKAATSILEAARTFMHFNDGQSFRSTP